ncbi:hybrid signal transduction histidine kinase M, partial [Tanacetum coccineum]
EWLKIDSIVKSWIFFTLSDTLQKRIVVADPQSAKEAWDHIEKIFHDNERTRTIALKGELRMIKFGDLTVDEYFRKIESISAILTSFDSPMNNDDIVTYVLRGLSEKYNYVEGIIAHRDPFPDLNMVRSMITAEEMRLKSKSQASSIDSSSSSPTILLVESTNNSRRGTN